MSIDSTALIEALLRAGTLSDIDRARAIEARRPEETLLSAMLRVTPVRLSELISLQFGPNGLPANTERPLSDRLGYRLVTAKALTQFQLKQALMRQVEQPQPLGRLLHETQGISQAAVDAALSGQAPLKPRLPEGDQLGSLLIRWGILTPEQWRDVLRAGRNPAETLLAQHLCNREHLQRAHLYIQEKRALLLRRRHRLGDVLVAMGRIDRETLAKALACQVDQPFLLGELLVMQRYCSPEAVLEGLEEQQRRYDADAEAVLPPLTPVQPPEVPVPEPEIEQAPPVDRRRVLAIALAVTVIIGGATWYGMRFGQGKYGWLGMFNRQSQAESAPARSAQGDVLGGTAQGPDDQGPASQYDALNIPGGQGSLEAASAGMETEGGVRYDPFAKDGAPTTPNVAAPMSELPREGPRSEGAYGSLSGAQPAQVPGAYPISGKEGVDGTRYQMSGTSGDRAAGTDGKPQTAQLAQAGARPDGQVMPGARFDADPLRKPEGERAFTAPANVPPPPVQASSRKMSQQSAELDERTINRSGAVFHYRLGQAHFTQGRSAAARQEFLAALATDPSNPLPYYYLGRLDEVGGRKAAALAAYERYLTRTPNGEFRADVGTRIERLKN